MSRRERRWQAICLERGEPDPFASKIKCYLLSRHEEEEARFCVEGGVVLLHANLEGELDPESQAAFAQELFSKTYATRLYVVDYTELSQGFLAELACPQQLSTVCKPLLRVLTKLNVASGTLVAQGVSATLALKLLVRSAHLAQCYTRLCWVHPKIPQRATWFRPAELKLESALTIFAESQDRLDFLRAQGCVEKSFEDGNVAALVLKSPQTGESREESGRGKSPPSSPPSSPSSCEAQVCGWIGENVESLDCGVLGPAKEGEEEGEPLDIHFFEIIFYLDKYTKQFTQMVSPLGDEEEYDDEEDDEEEDPQGSD